LVGSATAAAISTSPEFSASAPVGEGPFIVTVNNASVGNVVDIRDGSAATGFAFSTGTQGIDVSVDPAPGGDGITVGIPGDATGTTVANETGSAVNANIRFSASVAGSVVTITNASAGAAVDAADFDTGFVISTLVQGASTPNIATAGSITNVVGAGVGGSPIGVSTFDLRGSVWRICESNLFPNPDYDVETS
jgi:phage tail sheath gpL-like